MQKNNSMVRSVVTGHVSAGLFRCDVLFLQGKQDGFRYVVASV